MRKQRIIADICFGLVLFPGEQALTAVAQMPCSGQNGLADEFHGRGTK
jgi:hypothetical protein